MGIERRRYDRIHAKLPVRARFGEREAIYEGTCLNLNERGMFAHLSSLPNTGELVHLEFELGPGSKTIRAQAELSWIMPMLIGSTQTIGVGLRFIDIDPEGLERIRAVTKKIREVRQGTR